MPTVRWGSITRSTPLSSLEMGQVAEQLTVGDDADVYISEIVVLLIRARVYAFPIEESRRLCVAFMRGTTPQEEGGAGREHGLQRWFHGAPPFPTVRIPIGMPVGGGPEGL
jgi:hypothetical protein